MAEFGAVGGLPLSVRQVRGTTPESDRFVILEGIPEQGLTREEAARVGAKLLTLVIGTDDEAGRKICNAIGEQVEEAARLGKFSSGA